MYDGMSLMTHFDMHFFLKETDLLTLILYSAIVTMREVYFVYANNIIVKLSERLYRQGK